MDWDSSRHPDALTKNGVATVDDVIRDWSFFVDQFGLPLGRYGRDSAI